MTESADILFFAGSFLLIYAFGFFSRRLGASEKQVISGTALLALLVFILAVLA